MGKSHKKQKNTKEVSAREGLMRSYVVKKMSKP
jgi:hypothetical protein